MQARVVVYRNGKQELCVPVVEAGTSIGRDVDNPVQLLLPEVSKRHAFLQRTPKGWCIRDLNSRNGLFVNGSKVQETIVKDGDRITVGPYMLVLEITETVFSYRPRLQIDDSTNAAQQTIPAQRNKN